MVNFERFREAVRTEFGDRMEHATPEHVREFILRVYAEMGRRGKGQGYSLDLAPDTAQSYEQVVNEFFARVLDLPRDQALILLWLFAGELFYSRLGEFYSQELPDLATFDIQE